MQALLIMLQFAPIFLLIIDMGQTSKRNSNIPNWLIDDDLLCTFFRSDSK